MEAKIIIVVVNFLFLGVGFLWGKSLTKGREHDIRQTRENTKELLWKLQIEEPFLLKERNTCRDLMSNIEFKCRKAMDALYRSPMGIVPNEAQKYYRKEKDTFL